VRLEKRQHDPFIFTGSMADVTFLLIIYFMLTMAFSATKGLDFVVPPEDPSRREVQPEEAVYVQVKSDGSYLVDGHPLRLAEFSEYLRGKIDPGASVPVISKPVILRPEGDAPYGAMMDAFDELRQVRRKLNLAKDLKITLPTEREIENVWGALGVLTTGG
jgi:biopolymer transport protein ExbD